ncbi:MraY family glycosyltransferase [Promineifilum sp.]|uniref:MraY family glycosyltransferase n=1 Tax=Promineifilum sp. TaxID=2664178 RepID=UPI0035AFF3B3
MVYLFVALASMAAALVAAPAARWLSFRLNLVAEPGGRRRHQGRIPKLGGLAIFAGWLVGVALTYWLLPPADPHDALRLRGVVLGSLVVVAGGLLDDRYDLPPWAQLVIQLLGALIAILHIIFIEVFTNPLPGDALWTALPLFRVDENNWVWIWRPLALLFTTFWVVGMINAVNFLDGLDGLAAGVCLIAAAFFAFHSYRLGQVTVPLFPLALAGALFGFLRFNFAPARIFLGSAGAYFLGYQMATLSILSPAKLSTALLVMAVPIIDVAWQIISRLRHGQHPMRGDRGHLHFRLADSGLATRHIVLGYYAVAILFGLVAVLVASRLLKVAILAGLALAVLALLLRLSHKEASTDFTDYAD